MEAKRVIEDVEDHDQKCSTASQPIQHFKMLFSATGVVDNDGNIHQSDHSTVEARRCTPARLVGISPDSERQLIARTQRTTKSPCQRRVVRRSTDQDLIIPRCHIPGILLFVECLQYAVVDRNRNCFRFAGRKCDPRPSHQPLVRFVCTQWKPCVHLGNFGPGRFPVFLTVKRAVFVPESTLRPEYA